MLYYILYYHIAFCVVHNNCTGRYYIDIVVMSRGEWYDDNWKRTIPRKQGIPSYLYSFTYTFKISF